MNGSWGGEQMLDSMLAETGYAIPECQLPELADRIQHLENLVATATCDLDLDPALLTNPSDMSAWIDTLIKGTCTTTTTSATDALAAAHAQAQSLPDSLSCSSEPGSKPAGDQNSSSSSGGGGGGSLSLPVMMMQQDEAEAEASGLRLIHLLLACAACIEDNGGEGGVQMVNEIRLLVASMGDRAGAMGRVALYFAQGLERRILLLPATKQLEDESHVSEQHEEAEEEAEEEEDPGLLEMLQLHFYHTCPYVKFGHFTANQALVEELQGEDGVLHIVDLDLGLGLQWPPLIHMLAIRPAGPPRLLRFTAVAPPRLHPQLHHTAMRLAHLAASVNLRLTFHLVHHLRAVVVQPGETVAVNSMMNLHRHLHAPAKLAALLDDVRRLNPKIFTVVEQDASHNSPCFQTRFVDALHFYSSMFDSLQDDDDDGVIASQMYLGRQITNIVACEGRRRLERHERLQEWRHRLYSMGFRPRHLGSNAYNQAATLLTIFPAAGHTVQETAGCLTLGWHSRPLVAASAWRCS